MKTITTIKVGETLQAKTNYHMDDRTLYSSFEILAETKKRFKVRITSEITNCNDWRKTFYNSSRRNDNIIEKNVRGAVFFL